MTSDKAGRERGAAFGNICGRFVVVTAVVIAAFVLSAGVAAAATYKVGPTKEIKEIQDVTERLEPGDVVEVDGGATYGSVKFTKSGTAEKPITVRGIRVDGKRPVISGGTNTVEFRLSNYCVFEGFEVTGGTSRGLYHHAAFITVRDTVVRDCPGTGIAGADNDSGSLLLEYVEVARCGNGLYSHPIYMSTDPVKFPGAVFRMQFSWVHDGKGGNAVKSRSERNEIYYNCIESGFYRELELIGRDSEQAPRPMNSDVVGNVLIKTSQYPVVRIGHDSHGLGTMGRYRFVNNTIVLSPEASVVLQAYGKLEGVEMHNNVIYRKGGGAVKVLDESDAEWTKGKRICSGQNNWVMKDSQVPAEWTGTIVGTDPKFVDIAKNVMWPATGSPLISAGTAAPKGPEGYAFPNPLFPPAFEPPFEAVGLIGSAAKRVEVRTLDIGAFEYPSGEEAGAK